MSTEDFNNGLIIGLSLNGITIANGADNNLAIDDMQSSIAQLLVKYTGNSDYTIFNRRIDNSNGKYIYDCLNNGSRVVLTPLDEEDIIYSQPDETEEEKDWPFYVYQKYNEAPDFDYGFWFKSAEPLDDVIVLDELPVTGTETWTYTTSYPYYGSHCCASILNKIGYFFGGYTYPTRTRKLNTVTGSWTSKSDIPSGDRQMTSAVIGHKIYVAGGATYQTTLRTYDADTSVWTSADGMPYGGGELNAMPLDGPFTNEGYLYVFGSTYIREYNPATETWTSVTSYLGGTTSMAGCKIQSKVYLFGGAASTARNYTRIYDINTGVWTSGAEMPLADYGMCCAYFGDIIYVFGGVINKTGRRVYNLSTNEWVSYTDVPYGGYGAAAVGMGNTLYMCGTAGNYVRKLTLSLKHSYDSGISLSATKNIAVFYIGKPQKYGSTATYYTAQIAKNIQISPINVWVCQNDRLYDEIVYIKNNYGLNLLKE